MPSPPTLPPELLEQIGALEQDPAARRILGLEMQLEGCRAQLPKLRAFKLWECDYVRAERANATEWRFEGDHCLKVPLPESGTGITLAAGLVALVLAASFRRRKEKRRRDLESLAGAVD